MRRLKRGQLNQRLMADGVESPDGILLLGEFLDRICYYHNERHHQVFSSKATREYVRDIEQRMKSDLSVVEPMKRSWSSATVATAKTFESSLCVSDRRDDEEDYREDDDDEEYVYAIHDDKFEDDIIKYLPIDGNDSNESVFEEKGDLVNDEDSTDQPKFEEMNRITVQQTHLQTVENENQLEPMGTVEKSFLILSDLCLSFVSSSYENAKTSNPILSYFCCFA